jgi:predicted membrane-bound spermidine synthase
MSARLATTSKGKPPADADSTLLSGFVAACFFLSGAAGLVYQVIWVRLLDKVIGGAPFAVAAVLSVFMAGLANLYSLEFFRLVRERLNYPHKRSI